MIVITHADNQGISHAYQVRKISCGKMTHFPANSESYIDTQKEIYPTEMNELRIGRKLPIGCGSFSLRWIDWGTVRFHVYIP